jgi:hypothetical protein
MMAVIHNTTLIQRPPVEVFDYLVDLRNELEWNPDVESMEKLTDGPLALGTKYLAKWKQIRLLEVECTRFDRPREWVYVPQQARRLTQRRYRLDAVESDSQNQHDRSF